MFRHSFQPKILLKNSLAALLTISLSGVFYLFCCQAMKAVEKSEHCPLSKTVQTEHCDFSKKASETPQSAASINLFECCQLKFNSFVAKLEKNEFPQQTPARVDSHFSLPDSIKFSVKVSPADFSYRGPVFQSLDLNVKNCVFRI